MIFCDSKFLKKIVFPIPTRLFRLVNKIASQVNVVHTLNCNIWMTIYECTRRGKAIGLYNRGWNRRENERDECAGFGGHVVLTLGNEY